MPNSAKQPLASRIINWSIDNRILVLLLSGVLVALGLYNSFKLPIDAIPDLSDTQVIIRTEYPGQAPQVVEDQITYPLTTQLLGLPKAKAVRGYSMFGTSFIYIIFEEGTDLYWIRSRVLEVLSQVNADLPTGVTPELGPDATGVGWVYQYALRDTSGTLDLADLRSLQDWFLKFELVSVPGVSEVASVGGFVKEYQILIEPNKLRAYNVPLPRILQAVKNASQEVGGRTIELSETEYIIRGKGYAQTLNDFRNTVVFAENGTPVTLNEIATIQQGPAFRRGIAELNGLGETVGGIVIMRQGYNALDVIESIKKKLLIVQQGLPKGVEIVPVYDRSELILGAVSYLKGKLIEESLMVAFVCFIFLLHIRSALVTIISLPLGIIAALAIMSWQGITANLMSLGGIAIAIGTMVDAGIVMVENAHRKLALVKDISFDARLKCVKSAATEVGPSIFFSLLIITVSFFPVFALTGQSAKLFLPLAYTKTYAMAFACILAVTVIPVLMLYLLKGKIITEDKNPLSAICVQGYKPLLAKLLNYPKSVMAVSLLLLMTAFYPLKHLSSEFMPPLNEGSLLYMPSTLPGISSQKSREIIQVLNRLIMQIPEVELSFAKAGRADTATDPAPLSMIETWIKLKPQSQWREGLTIKDINQQITNAAQLPGEVGIMGYPIKIRLDMLSTGIRSPIGIKVSGPDLDGIGRITEQIERIIKNHPGTKSAIAERVTGGNYIEIIPNRFELARFGIDLSTLQLIISTALGGAKLSEVIDGRERYNVIVRYANAFRESLDDLNNILLPTPQGAHVTLSEVADIKITRGPPMIVSENARLNGWVFIDTYTTDHRAYIKAVQPLLNDITLPSGFSLSFQGQFEQLETANERLIIAVPITIIIIVILLYLHFSRWDHVLLIFTSVPFALLGGLWAVYLFGHKLSVASAIGFIALSGVAIETAIVMLLYIDNAIRAQQIRSITDVYQAIIHGAVLRLRPKLMTVSTILLGLLPIFFTDGPGAEMMRRIALPMLGGLTSTLVLTLLVIPVVYYFYLSHTFDKTLARKNQGC